VLCFHFRQITADTSAVNDSIQVFCLNLSLPNSLASDMPGNFLSSAEHSYFVITHLDQEFLSYQLPGHAVMVAVNFNASIVVDDSAQFSDGNK
jgi:hypothetical protein